MRTLVHLSDLHFGRTDEELLGPLIECVHALAPDLVVVSGDLTQRARRGQFREAAEFLSRLPQPQLVVPGNHDVPLYDVFSRFFRPLARYRRYIERSLCPVFFDEELAVLGLNTARSLVIKNGRVSRLQMRRVREHLSGLPDEVVKVIVTHHPFDSRSGDEGDLIGRAREGMGVFAECGVDLLLAGHLHASGSHDSGERYALQGYEALIVGAGTATSTRGRGERNSFNRVRVQPRDVEVERYEWQPETRGFVPAGAQRFLRRDRAWEPARRQ
ncbi:MAG TPA: metallophosphoesterase family protein [Burkholderiaceae bacterium]|nr:metallophosphoesterase family protein [Burkholderiaceae bacterium]